MCENRFSAWQCCPPLLGLHQCEFLPDSLNRNSLWNSGAHVLWIPIHDVHLMATEQNVRLSMELTIFHQQEMVVRPSQTKMKRTWKVVGKRAGSTNASDSDLCACPEGHWILSTGIFLFMHPNLVQLRYFLRLIHLRPLLHKIFTFSSRLQTCKNAYQHDTNLFAAQSAQHAEKCPC